MAEVAREGGSNAHGGRVRRHKKGELLNIGATQEVPSSLGGDTKGREGGEVRARHERDEHKGQYHVWERKAGKVFFVS